MEVDQRLGGFGRRTLALAIDYLMIYPPALVLAVAGWYAHRTVFVEAGFALFIVGGGTYLVVGWRNGRTVGMRVLHLRVISCRSGGQITWAQSITRLAGFALSYLPWGLGLLSVLWNRRRQGWHDRLAATLVVRD